MTVTFDLQSKSSRLLLMGGTAVCLALISFSAAVLFGNSIAKGAEQIEVAELAVRLSPNDPQAYFTYALLLERSLLPGDLPRSQAMFEKAAALAPNDYRYWVSLGKSRERNGNAEGGEAALRRAERLAPEYAEVQWTLGNLLIRLNKTEEGFAAVRKAVKQDKKYSGPAASIALDIFEGDIARVLKAVGDSSPVKVSLALYLAGQERFDESMKLWRSLPESEIAADYAEEGKKILSNLLEAKKFRAAIGLRRQLPGFGGSQPSLGTVTNGGFEEEVSTTGSPPFDWTIAPGEQPVIAISVDHKHSGGKSLVVLYDGSARKEFREISQVIAVEAERPYKFEALYRSELEASATFRWEVADAGSGEVLGATEAFLSGSDWKAVSVEFTTIVDTEGVIVRLVREMCVNTGCSISGSFWLDDISLK